MAVCLLCLFSAVLDQLILVIKGMIYMYELINGLMTGYLIPILQILTWTRECLSNSKTIISRHWRPQNVTLTGLQSRLKLIDHVKLRTHSARNVQLLRQIDFLAQCVFFLIVQLVCPLRGMCTTNVYSTTRIRNIWNMEPWPAQAEMV